MYSDNIIIQKWGFIPPIPDYMIPVDCCNQDKYVINFTTDEMLSKF